MAKNQRRRAATPAPKPAPAPAPAMKDDDFDNELRGALFQNPNKIAGDKRPDYKGSAEVDGIKYWLAGWKKKSKQGAVYVSLSFELQDGQELEPEAPAGNSDDLSF